MTEIFVNLPVDYHNFSDKGSLILDHKKSCTMIDISYR